MAGLLVVAVGTMSAFLAEPACAANLTNPVFPPWGDTLFGAASMESQYVQAGVMEVRHQGWSWTPKELRKAAPSCASVYINGSFAMSTCGVGDACDKVGGTPLHSLYCMEANKDKPFAIAGPSCWNRKCFSDTRDMKYAQESCAAGGGFFDSSSRMGAGGTGNADWCYYPGRHAVLGPACYGTECYDVKEPCTRLGGTVFADMYCVMDEKYTVIGPICEPYPGEERCFQDDTVAICDQLGGVSVAEGLFCVVEGRFSALGPFIFGSIYNYTDDSQAAGFGPVVQTDLCEGMGGTALGNGLFCLLPGNDYHAFSDCWGGSCSGIGRLGNSGDTDYDYGSFCEDELGGTNIGRYGCLLKGAYSVGSKLFWGDTQFISEANSKAAYLAGSFVMDGSYAIYGPTCYGSNCYVGSDECSKVGGESIGGIFCAVSESPPVTMVIGPILLVCLSVAVAAIF